MSAWASILHRTHTLQQDEDVPQYRKPAPKLAPKKSYTIDVPTFPDLPIIAFGDGGVVWSRWGGETAKEFQERVRADAARLGVHWRFVKR